MNNLYTLSCNIIYVVILYLGLCSKPQYFTPTEMCCQVQMSGQTLVYFLFENIFSDLTPSNLKLDFIKAEL